jgi:cupin fold WbuC family metalloprotein
MADQARTYRAESAEVLYSEVELTTCSRADIGVLKEASARNARKRIRLCAHRSPADALHEMLIVHARGTYVRPHKHPGKTESTHIVEGTVDVVVFDDAGNIDDVIRMGDYGSGRVFYYRMSAPLFHTLIIRSDVLVFHEITNGPFDRSQTVFAPWAPEDSDDAGAARFMSALDERLGRIK